VPILDHGLQLARATFLDTATEDEAERVGATDGSIGIQETLSQTVQGSPALEDEVVTVFDLGEEQTVLETGLASLPGGKEGGQISEPFLSATGDVLRLQGISELLKLLGVTTAEKSVGAWQEAHPLRLEALGQPVVLVEVDAGGEGEVRAKAHELAAPGAVVDIEVVLVYPTLLVFQMPLLGGAFTDADQDASGLGGFENGHDRIGRGASKIGSDEVLAPVLLRGVEDGFTRLAGAVLHPVVVLGGDVPEDLTVDRIKLTVAPEEAHHSLGLLKGLDRSVE